MRFEYLYLLFFYWLNPIKTDKNVKNICYRARVLSIVMGCFLFLPYSVSAAFSETAIVKRKILALYDGRFFKEPALTHIHKYAEMPLNYMGFDLRYHDVNKPLPKLSTLKDYQGVITWFGAPIIDSQNYLIWADKAMKSGLKFALLSDIGAEFNLKTKILVDRFLKHFGLKTKGVYVGQPRGTNPFKVNKDLIGFERPLYEVFPTYSLFSTSQKSVRVHLSVKPPIEYKTGEAVLVTTNKVGGFVHSGFSAFYDERINRTKWIIDPFKFFSLVFQSEDFPIPDVTTLVGRRMYFSHIDGDGWNNISYIERYRRTRSIAAKVVLEEFIRPYPDLPVSVALVTGDCDSNLGGDPIGCETVARDMFALPQVEVGSHTHTHPFNWQFFGNYSRKKEMALIEKYQPKESLTLRGRLTRFMAQFSGKLSNREKHKRYIAGSDKLPRAFMEKPYDLKSEIAGSLRIAERYAPKGKKAKLLAWSGNTMPRASHIKAVRDAGAYNLNGGDTRFDNEWPSVTYVTAISRMIDSERQIYAANSNENTYTNDWTGPYYGFLHLSETVENTEKPRRLKPFNIYYHSYSGERASALNAVKTHLDTARNSPVIPVAASHYSRVAGGFFSLKIKKLGALKWAFYNRGQLQTVRLDALRQKGINWDQSKGILGFNKHMNSVYIALDPAVKVPVLVLTKTKRVINSARRPVLEQSRWQINGLKAKPCKLSFGAEGFGQGDMVWHGIKEGLYTVKASRSGKILWHGDHRVGKNGTLTYGIKADAITPLNISITCKAKKPARKR